MTVDLATLTKEMFDPHLGSRFLMHVAPDRTIELELIATEPLSTPANAKRPSFLVRFRAAEGGHVPQQIYVLEHPVMGRLEIFLVPAGPDGVGLRYDAVFS
jgi:hypothetical protein